MCDIHCTLGIDGEQPESEKKKCTFYRNNRNGWLEFFYSLPFSKEHLLSFDITFAKKNTVTYSRNFSSLVRQGAFQNALYLRFHNLNRSGTFLFDFSKSPSQFSKLQSLHICHTKVTGIEHILGQLRHVTLIDNEINPFPAGKLSENLVQLELRETFFNEPLDLSHCKFLQKITLVDCDLERCPILPDTLSLCYLDVSCNRLSELPRLPDCIHELFINNNQITRIESFPSLLVSVNMWSNPLTRMPDNLLLCRYLHYVNMENTMLVLSELELRFLDRMRHGFKSISVYQDTQNVHNTAVQKSFLQSCNNLFRDSLTCPFPFSGTGNPRVDEMINRNMALKDTHCILGATYKDIFNRVWSRIQATADPALKSSLLYRLEQETVDSDGVCFMGKITRLLNVLTGFFEDIHIDIGESDQVFAKIMVHKQRNRGVVNFSVLSREIEEVVGVEKCKEWIEYLKETESEREREI
jgi:hypothetical protein